MNTEPQRKQIFCTLFDSGYLARGLACYESLLKQTEHFLLYVFAFDELTYEVLTKKKLKNVIPVRLEDFENEELLNIKTTRSRGEYCWTCTPATVKHVLEKYNHEHCTYIDADIYFYKNPESILATATDTSVLITPHHYTPRYDQSKTSGIYCVQYVYFRNDTYGKAALNWWYQRCIEWCFARVEGGKFGDQKYLDDWPTRFDKVFVSKNLGEGVAPWNIQQWTEVEYKKIIFYHFHGLKLFQNLAYSPHYKFPKWATSKIYVPYVQHLWKIDHSLKIDFSDYKSCFSDDVNFQLDTKPRIEEFFGANRLVRWTNES